MRRPSNNHMIDGRKNNLVTRKGTSEVCLTGRNPGERPGLTFGEQTDPVSETAGRRTMKRKSFSGPVRLSVKKGREGIKEGLAFQITTPDGPKIPYCQSPKKKITRKDDWTLHRSTWQCQGAIPSAGVNHPGKRVKSWEPGLDMLLQRTSARLDGLESKRPNIPVRGWRGTFGNGSPSTKTNVCALEGILGWKTNRVNGPKKFLAADHLKGEKGPNGDSGGGEKYTKQDQHRATSKKKKHRAT